MEESRPNIILVVLDTVRASNTSVYGHERDTTPFLDSLAEDSLKYNRAYAPAPWTTPSHASIFTGTYVRSHQTDRGNERLNPDIPTLAGLLRDEGYTAVGYSNNAHVSPDFDFDRGFSRFIFNGESYSEPLEGAVPVSGIRSATGNGSFPKQATNALRYVLRQDGSFPKTVYNWLYRKSSEAGLITSADRGADSTNEFVSRFLRTRTDEPFFLYLNYMEAHAPYQTPEEYQYRYVESPLTSEWATQEDYFGGSVRKQNEKIADLRDQYDGCIRYLDAKMAELVATLEECGYLDDSLLVVTSDHGEAFGEQGLYEHKSGVFDPLVRVPLLIHHPDDVAKTVETPVSIRWLFPTIAEASGTKTPDHAVEADILSPDGRSVFIESEGLPYDDWVYESSVSRKFSERHYGHLKDGMKLIHYEWNDVEELYRVGDESTDLGEQHPATVDRLRNTLDETVRDADYSDRSDSDEAVDIDESTREHLRELGYR